MEIAKQNFPKESNKFEQVSNEVVADLRSKITGMLFNKAIELFTNPSKAVTDFASFNTIDDMANFIATVTSDSD